jgi:imidazolonepropionase
MNLFDVAINNTRIAAMTGNSHDPIKRSDLSHVGIQNGVITRISSGAPLRATHEIDAQGRWLLPGFIDCHTHLVYGGNRSDEFAARARGESYEAIAKKGGGILSTVSATRAASFDTLYHAAIPRLARFIEEGVTRIEIKSGYGLTTTDELKQLEVARKLGEQFPIGVSTTLLAAHATPPEYANNSDQYVDFICHTIIPEAAEKKLADAVDMFCENIGFSTAQCKRIIEVAQQHSLSVKMHAEQLSHQGGAELVAHYGGLSADHIERIQASDIEAMAKNGTVGVLLPSAYFTLKDTVPPPVEAMRTAGVKMAIASDYNPGSSPFCSLLIQANLAVTQFGVSCEEALGNDPTRG